MKQREFFVLYYQCQRQALYMQGYARLLSSNPSVHTKVNLFVMQVLELILTES